MLKHWITFLLVSIVAVSSNYAGWDKSMSDIFSPRDRVEVKQLPMVEQLKQELGQLQEPVVNISKWIEGIVADYNHSYRNEPIKLILTDFDRDGIFSEWVTVLYEDILDEPSGEIMHHNAYGVYITNRDGKLSLQSFLFPYGDFGNASIDSVVDLTGDGIPEVVWAYHNSGAHTTHSFYTVSSWSDGVLERLQSEVDITSVSKTEIVDGKLMITGGLINSAGAGLWQREYTDTYTIINHTIRRVDRVFSTSTTPYHHLIDGLWAEIHGYREQALQHYNKAEAIKSTSYKGLSFVFGGEWVEEGVHKDQEAEFERIIKQFALLRKELLTQNKQGMTAANACAVAKKKAGYEESWLQYLNAPAGYANPTWGKDMICSGIDELTD